MQEIDSDVTTSKRCVQTLCSVRAIANKQNSFLAHAEQEFVSIVNRAWLLGIVFHQNSCGIVYENK
jgi:hypothetical protein